MYLVSDVFSLLVHFEFFTFCQVCLLVKETVEIEIGMAEKSSWEQANKHAVLPLNYFMFITVNVKVQNSWKLTKN
jgi:hypothetical protein